LVHRTAQAGGPRDTNPGFQVKRSQPLGRALHNAPPTGTFVIDAPPTGAQVMHAPP
jgi:hypothetical protein